MLPVPETFTSAGSASSFDKGTQQFEFGCISYSDAIGHASACKMPHCLVNVFGQCMPGHKATEIGDHLTRATVDL